MNNIYILKALQLNRPVTEFDTLFKIKCVDVIVLINASGIVGLVLHSRTHCLNGREIIKQSLEDLTPPKQVWKLILKTCLIY